MLTLTRGQALMLLVPVTALLVVVGQRLLGSEESRATPAPVPVERDGSVRAEEVQLVVHVSGAVENPGLYRLPEGARVADAVRRAGGLKPRADMAVVNLAAPLVDGEHVVVARRPAPDDAGAGAEAPTGAPAKVQLSSATVEELDALPGIGPVTAQKIVDWRAANGPFRSVDDLDAIPGIGPARVEQLRDLVVP